MVTLIFLFFASLVSAQNTVLLPIGTLVSGSLPASSSSYYSITYIFNPRSIPFEINVFRTSIYQRYSGPSLNYQLTDPYGGNDYSFYGKKIVYPYTTGNYSFTISGNYYSYPYNFQIKVCYDSCPSSCPYESYLGFCNTYGACVNGICQCDNTTYYIDTYDCSLSSPPYETGSLWTLWITFIILGVFLVIILPCLVYICYRRLAVNNAERKPIVQHYHNTGVGPAMGGGEGTYPNNAPAGGPGVYYYQTWVQPPGQYTQYPPNQYPTNQYPTNQYPTNQYPPPSTFSSTTTPTTDASQPTAQSQPQTTPKENYVRV